MLDMKKVVLFGTTLVVAIGCTALAKSTISKRNRGDSFKAKYTNSQNLDSQDDSGDKVKKPDGKKIKKKQNCKELTEEEKAAIKEKRESISEEKKLKKEKYEQLTDEEKEALKESRINKRQGKMKKNRASSSQETEA